MKTKIIQNIKSIILALILVLGVGYVSAAWTAAPANPPSNNTPAPINVGGVMGVLADLQTKTGDLNLTGILTSSHLFTRDLTVTNSDGTATNIASGSVLVADGNNTGKVKWGTVATGGSTSTTTTTIITNIMEIVDTTLDPIVCNASGMASDGATDVDFTFTYSGPPAPATPTSISNCYYVSNPVHNASTRVNMQPLVASGAYVGVLKSMNAVMGFLNYTPILVSGGISGQGGFFHTNVNNSVVNVSAIYIPTGLKFRQALQQ